MLGERYNRQIILHGFGIAAQDSLASASVLVIGAGGLGCPSLQYLAAAGVGNIGIVDDDLVSITNLHRQILYRQSDIGKPKAQTAAARLNEANPEISVTAYNLRLKKENILAILKDYDFILDGTDNFESRYLINDACTLLKKPLVFAAVSGFEGQLAIFNIAEETREATNYRDLFPIPPKAGEIANCAENGIIGVLPGIIGTMAAAEIIKLIANIGSTLINKLSHLNMLTLARYELNISKGKDYKLPETEEDFLAHHYGSNSSAKAVREITFDKVLELIELGSTLILDVRERHEQPDLPGLAVKKIPLSELPIFLDGDLKAENIILICQYGIRSLAAAEILFERYANTKNIYSLKGGIFKLGSQRDRL